MVTSTKINGLLIVEGLRFPDNRGELLKPFSGMFFNRLEEKINLDIKEVWFTKSNKNVIRGMHLQVGELASEKIVSVISGRLLDVILDIRKDSPTYGETFEIELCGTTPLSLYIPQGCAHGYKVLDNDTITMYMSTQLHDAKNDVGIKWDSFGYDWKISEPILSEKDLALPNFNK